MRSHHQPSRPIVSVAHAQPALHATVARAKHSAVPDQPLQRALQRALLAAQDMQRQQAAQYAHSAPPEAMPQLVLVCARHALSAVFLVRAAKPVRIGSCALEAVGR